MTDHVISRNPATGAILATYPLQTAEELDRSLAQSAEAAELWGKVQI